MGWRAIFCPQEAQFAHCRTTSGAARSGLFQGIKWRRHY